MATSYTDPPALYWTSFLVAPAIGTFFGLWGWLAGGQASAIGNGAFTGLVCGIVRWLWYQKWDSTQPRVYRKWLGTIIVTSIGVVCLWLSFTFAYHSIPFFTDPKYRGFWNDAEASLLSLRPGTDADPETKKDIDFYFGERGIQNPEQAREIARSAAERQLTKSYGEQPVKRYLFHSDFMILTIPNEKSATISALSSLTSEKPRFQSEKVTFLFFGLGIIYIPMIVTARNVQRLATYYGCRSAGSVESRTQYFKALDERGLRAVVGAFALTLAISLVNATIKSTPALQDQGITVFALATIFLVVAYFGGLWMRLVSMIVDSGLLMAGKNPHRSVWDELIAFVIVAPVLGFVFQNGLLTLLTMAVAGLGSGLFEKWSLRRSARKSGIA